MRAMGNLPGAAAHGLNDLAVHRLDSSKFTHDAAIGLVGKLSVKIPSPCVFFLNESTDISLPNFVKNLSFLNYLSFQISQRLSSCDLKALGRLCID